MTSSSIEPSAFAGLRGLWHEICYFRFFMKKFHRASTIPLEIFFRKIPKILATEGCSPATQAKTVEKYQHNKYCWKVPMTLIAKNLSPVLLKPTLTVVINSQLRISPRNFRKNSKWPQIDAWGNLKSKISGCIPFTLSSYWRRLFTSPYRFFTSVTELLFY